jgi:hypothetical protein
VVNARVAARHLDSRIGSLRAGRERRRLHGDERERRAGAHEVSVCKIKLKRTSSTIVDPITVCP